MKRYLLALTLLLSPLAGEAHAQTFARSAVCMADNSEAASMSAIASDPAAWMGKCVKVEGLYSNERVYADADAIYGLNPNAIGGFIDGTAPMPGAWRGVFTGRVADCAVTEEIQLNAQLRAPGISLNGRTLGCTTGEGPYLMFMTGSQLKPSGLKRRLPGAKGASLERVDGAWDHHDGVVALAQLFEQAMQSETPDMLAGQLNNRYVAERLHAGDGSALAALKTPAKWPFALFRDTRVTDVDHYAAEACWGLKKGADKRWPIDSRDADNQSSRPYACLRIEGRRETGDIWRVRVDASRDVSGLEEP